MKEKNIKTQENNPILFELEQGYWRENKIICGIDEVGRGCLAGPIVTAAVILKPHAINVFLKDSKLMSKVQLEIISKWIMINSTYSIGISNNRIIDQKNIYTATQISMKKALFHLLQSTEKKPDLIAIDAMPLQLINTPYDKIPVASWTQGESKSASIAAASILAKVTRDNIMKIMHNSFPSYGLEKHKGYGTAAHIQALKNNKACVVHRSTFIKNFKGKTDETTEQQSLFS